MNTSKGRSIRYIICSNSIANYSTNYRELPRALDEFKPDMVVYNAGTDTVKGDPLGVLDITSEIRH